MSSSLLHLFLFTTLLAFSFPCRAQNSTRPDTLILPVRRDAATNQFVAVINQRTPLIPVTVTVHLGGPYLWVDCDSNYVSSTYRPARCRSAQCSLVGSNSDTCGSCFDGPRPGCNNDTCGLHPENPFIHTTTYGEAAQDVLAIRSTVGSNLGPVSTVPQFIFGCGHTFLIQGLASGATGLLGLGRGRIGAPSLFAAAFSLQRRFFVCLSPSTTADGAIFFGAGRRMFDNLYRSGIQESQLGYTPLYINPVSTAGTYLVGEASVEYFVRVNAIRINNNPIPINNTLLSIDRNGNGGTKISTVNRYTLLETSIYREFTSAFIREAAAMNLQRVAGVAPFEVCFNMSGVGASRTGPFVPTIDLELQGENAVWRIMGANSMIMVNNNEALCLGFQDAGVNPETAIVIGTMQLEDNLVMFDLARSRMGFSGTLLRSQTDCTRLEYTSRG